MKHIPNEIISKSLLIINKYLNLQISPQRFCSSIASLWIENRDAMEIQQDENEREALLRMSKIIPLYGPPRVSRSFESDCTFR